MFSVTEHHAGAAIRAARQAQGLSLRRLAALIDVSPATMSGIEHGTTPVTVTRLERIATVLNTTAADLLQSDAAPAPRLAQRPDERSAPPAGSADGDWRSFDAIAMDPVLHAAVGLFVRRGYHATSIREIATGAGLSVAGLYHHYPSKHSILVAVLELTMAEIAWRVDAARDQGATAVESFALMVEALALFHAVRGDLAFIGASEMRAFDGPERHRMIALRDQVQWRLDDQAQRCVDAGDFHPGDLRTATRAVATMCTSLPSWFRAGGRRGAGEVARDYAAFAVSLMRSPSP